MKTLKPLTLFLIIALTLFLAACAQGQSEAQPPEIRYGETICAQCNMIISDQRFAAGYAYEISSGRYESIAFDDIGEMLKSAAAHPDRIVASWFVHDYDSKEWMDATQAHFMVSDNLTTPMGDGIAAFADRAAAEGLAAEFTGEVLDWQTLVARFESGMLGSKMPGM